MMIFQLCKIGIDLHPHFIDEETEGQKGDWPKLVVAELKSGSEPVRAGHLRSSDFLDSGDDRTSQALSADSRSTPFPGRILKVEQEAVSRS